MSRHLAARATAVPRAAAAAALIAFVVAAAAAEEVIHHAVDAVIDRAVPIDPAAGWQLEEDAEL